MISAGSPDKGPGVNVIFFIYRADIPPKIINCHAIANALALCVTFMRIQNFYLFFLLILMTSCEGIIRGEGKITSSDNKLPIDSVKIDWLGKIVYSDKNGNFSFDEFVGCVPSCPDLELILTKQGYEPKYINLTKENKKNKTVFELTPGNNNLDDLSRSSHKQFLFYLSVVTALTSLLTLITLAVVRLKNKLIWFVTILFGTLTIFYNYLSATIEFKVFRPSIFIFPKYTFEPSWYQLNLPIGLIIFWICYLMQIKNKVRK